MSKKLLLILISSVLALVLLVFFAVISWDFFMGDKMKRSVTTSKCGDGICDELEKKNSRACPQDCKPTDTKTETCGPDNKGYCIDFKEECKTGYEDIGPDTCYRGRSAGCCAPVEGSFDPCDLNKDGKVDEKEKKICEQEQPIQQSKCGDGVCDPKEKETGICPEDCGPIVNAFPDPLSFWVLHCEYPGGTPDHPTLVGTNHWEGLADKIKWADTYGVKLSLAITGRWANAALNDGHKDTILNWIANGHVAGTHTDPEIKKEGGGWILYNWDTIPEDKMKQAIDDAVDTVNELIGCENNKFTDNPAAFWSAFGGKGYFPEQMTHYLLGNFGHNYPCQISLSDGREITFVAYGGVIRKNTQEWGLMGISPEDMISEYNKGGETYGTVHFPGGGLLFASSPLVKWMQWLYNNEKPRVGVTSISGPPARDLDKFVRMWTEFDETLDDSLIVKIKIQNSLNTDLTNIKITHYMPLTYCDLEPGSDLPSATSFATVLRRHLIWDNQTIPKNNIVTYTYTGKRTDISGSHRIENRADTYLDDLSEIPLISRRFAMFDLGDWGISPFESVIFIPSEE